MGLQSAFTIEKNTRSTQGILKMMTKERNPKRLYRAYERKLTVDVTSEQLGFLRQVQEASGSTLADTIRSAVNLWMAGVSATGKE